MLVWNYRGYGLTKSRSCLWSHKNQPTVSSIKEDSESVITYLRNKIGVRGKIGVYGRSLGGIATTHLCKYVDMIIADRTFGNLHDVAETKFFGRMAVNLLKFATNRWWRATSDRDLISVERDYKFSC